MNFPKKMNNKAISKALAMGIIASSMMPIVNTDERVSGEKNTTDTQNSRSSAKYAQVTCNTLNVRKGSSTKYAIAGTITKGTKVKYISTCSNGWYKVEYKGSIRYVSNKYTKIVNGSSQNNGSSENNNSSSTNNDVIKKVGKVNISSLNVRSGAGTKYGVKRTIKKGDVVGILKTYSSGWTKVKLSSSSTGYVSAKYLSIKSGNSSDIKVSTSSNSSSSTSNSSTTSNKNLQKVLSTVKAQVGKPYVYGAAGPNSFDCSGLTYYAYKQVGTYLNRSSRAQASNGTYVSKSNLKPGDLVFFNSGSNTIRHVGMYVGNGQFVHSPSPGKSVKYENLNSSYYVKGYVTARRIIK